LRQLHWLPVQQRIQYKLASLAFRVLSGLVPDYLILLATVGWLLFLDGNAGPAAGHHQQLLQYFDTVGLVF